ncbi:hypothetical protein ABZ446_45715 [Streptomyces sp. NPDC005813]
MGWQIIRELISDGTTVSVSVSADMFALAFTCCLPKLVPPQGGASRATQE